MPARPFTVDVTCTIKKLTVSQPPLYCDRSLSISIAPPGRRDEFISRSVLFNAHGMTPKRSKQHFNKNKELRYSVRIHSRSPNGVINGVRYMSCFTFGRGRREVTGRTAKTSRNVTFPHVYRSIRPVYYLRHLRDHHPEKWREFDGLVDTKEKMSFFECEVPFANRVTSHFSMTPSEIYSIHVPIVEAFILLYFVDSSCSNVDMLKEFKHVEEKY